MPWTGDWSDVTGRLKADTAEQVRQALVERAPIAGVAVPASLAIPIQGTLSATTARAIDSFFNDIVDANVFFDHTANGGVFSGPGATVLSIDTSNTIQGWTQATLFDAIGPQVRFLPDENTRKVRFWILQLYQMINLLLWSYASPDIAQLIARAVVSAVRFDAANITPLESRWGIASYQSQRIIAFNAAPWVPGMFPSNPGVSAIESAQPQHFDSQQYEHKLVRVKADYRMSDYVLTTDTLNHQSELVISFQAARRTSIGAAFGAYQNNDYPGIPAYQLYSFHTDAAPNTDNTFDIPRIGAFDTITSFTPLGAKFLGLRFGWGLNLEQSYILSNWNVAGGLTFVAP